MQNLVISLNSNFIYLGWHWISPFLYKKHFPSIFKQLNNFYNLYINKQKLCTAVAAFLHYFFLTVMCWMLSQGLYLYLKLRRSAKGTWDFVYFCLLGWGEYHFLIVFISRAMWPSRKFQIWKWEFPRKTRPRWSWAAKLKANYTILIFWLERRL